jgi:hypothetical protein
MMNNKETNDAAIALMNWFNSQEIDYGEACIVMSRVIAIVLINLPITKQNLANAIENFNEVLHCDVELFVGTLPIEDNEK